MNEAHMFAMQAIIAEQSRWASQSVPLSEITKENGSVIRDMARYSASSAVPMLASLLTEPELQSHCLRIETLIALAVIHCNGTKEANINPVIRWFNQMTGTLSVCGEDPAEDVFVTLVNDKERDYRLIEGIWEGAGFYTQQILNVIISMPDSKRFSAIKRSVRALLVISDVICSRAGLIRYQLGSDSHHNKITRNTIPNAQPINISFEDLENMGICLDDLASFCLEPESKHRLHNQEVGNSVLERHPLLILNTHEIIVALPTAISVAIRYFLLEVVEERRLVGSFNKALAQNYSKLFHKMPVLGELTDIPLYWRQVGPHLLSHFLTEVDKGNYISFHFFLPSLDSFKKGNFKEIYWVDSTLASDIKASIDESTRYASGLEGFQRGINVVIGCGWGQGFAMEPVECENFNWQRLDLSAAELDCLSWLQDMSPQYIWRVLDGKEEVEKAGVHLSNPNGLLNLIAWIQHNDGHLVPHDNLPEGRITPEHPIRLVPPLNLLRDIRVEVNHAYDRHIVKDHTDRSHYVERVWPRPLFGKASSRNLYVSLSDVENGQLTAVYHSKIKLWISTATPNITERRVNYKLWEATGEWLHRIGTGLEKCLEHLSAKTNIKVYIEFQDGDSELDGVNKPTRVDLEALCVIEQTGDVNARKITFKEGFISGFRNAENIAEQLIAEALIKSYLMILAQDDEITFVAILKTVVTNTEARHFHLFHAHSYLDFVKDSLPKQLVSINPIDDAAVKIGLGWRAQKDELAEIFEGKEECTGFLRNVVDVLYKEIINRLTIFDRTTTLQRLVSNIEKSNALQEHFEKTSAAILGLHEADPTTRLKYIGKISEFAGSNIASRVLIEMAICSCSLEGGKTLSDIELSKLIARASLLARIGGLSDAIHYNALPPLLKISPLGDILFTDDFGRSVVEPMLIQASEDKLITNIPAQKRNYDEPVIAPLGSSKDKINPEFWKTWEIEMGFNIEEARLIIDSLENEGIKQSMAAIQLNQDEYFSLVCSEFITEKVANAFLNQFSLVSRGQWDKPPKGFSGKDIFPWRFGRRLSYALRPILITKNCENPTMLIAPSSLRSAFAYLLSGAYSGRLEQDFFRSNEMKNLWWGKASEGHTFNTRVAQSLSDAGWSVREGIELTEVLNQKLDRNFGDVDVLAWRSDRPDVLVVECKDLSFARNYSEAAALLASYQGVIKNGEPDKLKRHLDRVELLQENLHVLERFTGVSGIKIVSCLICSGVVPMQYAQIDALNSCLVGDIKKLLSYFDITKGI